MPDGVELSPRSLADLRKLGDAYKGGDKILQKRLRVGLQAAARPLAAYVLEEGSAELPVGGGLRARVRGARAGITASLAARNVAVSIRIANREKDALGALDSGRLRHPVFNTGVWVEQQIPANKFSEAFARGAVPAQRRVRLEMDRALDEIAREA